MLFIEYPDYMCYKVVNDSDSNTKTTLIDWDVVIKPQSYNISVNKKVVELIMEHNKELKNNLVILSSKNINNNFNCKRILHDSIRVLQTQFGKYFKAYIILHKDGYHRFPYDGFKTVCETLQIKSIDRFITKPKSAHFDAYVKGCYNYNINELHTVHNRNTIMQSINPTKMQPSETRFYSREVFEQTIRSVNSLKRHLILLVGPPNIGKTTFAERLKGKTMRYIRTIIPNKKVRDNVAIYLDEKADDDDENLIIDGEHATEAERYMFIKACQVKNVACICVLFDVTKQECNYMNSYLFNIHKGAFIKKHTNGISRFYSRYQKPRLCEGLVDLINIHGIPCENDGDKIF